ncbi:hypothetical protein [Nitrosovibrio sp. Nv4]|uniref:hypothetical protein n=1 Tax=Nitrosovibrio sp. Nv4 TaxID=1945880 RepID=UPI000BCC1C1E|nr:hypothetical protein [Nitrosovibrio sp. Nv4]SOD41605.1 hypothetical protein SAMN06298226_1907 [Nitrosovibrio sp. Nv4]
MFVFEKLTQALAANQLWPLKIAANEARIVASSYPVTLEFRRMGQSIGSASNVQAGDFFRGVDFDEVVLKNGATAQSITLGLVSGQSGSDRVTGEVSVISGEVSRTKSGVAYAVGGYQAAVVAEYGYVYLWNPPASGKRLVVGEIAGCAEALGVWGVRSTVSQIGTAWGNLPGNKLIGGAGSVATLYVGTQVAHTGVPLTGYKSSTTEFGKIGLIEPVIVPAGYGVGVWCSGVNELVRGSFQYWEESL